MNGFGIPTREENEEIFSKNYIRHFRPDFRKITFLLTTSALL